MVTCPRTGATGEWQNPIRHTSFNLIPPVEGYATIQWIGGDNAGWGNRECPTPSPFDHPEEGWEWFQRERRWDGFLEGRWVHRAVMPLYLSASLDTRPAPLPPWVVGKGVWQWEF